MFHQTQLIKSAPIELPEAMRPAAPQPITQLDLRTLWSAVRSQKWLIAGLTLLSLLAAVAFAVIAKPQYMAVTQILIDPSDLRVVENGVTSNSQLPEVAVIQAESQVRVLTSDNVLRRVIASEHLDSDPKFVGSETSPLRSLINVVLAPLGRSEAAGRVDPTLAALYELQRRVKVKRAERTYVVDVAVTTNDREMSVRIANAIAEAYLAEQAAARSEAARRVSESLSARLSELKERVRKAEERVEEFKARNNIIGAGGQLVNEQQLTELNNQLSLARARTADTKSRYEQLQRLQRSGTDVGAFAEAVQSQTITALRAQYAEVMRREAEQTTSLGPRHPAVIEVHAQAQRLRRVIGEEIARIAEAAANDYERARASEESLARSLDALKRSAIETNDARVGLRELERDVQTNRAIYEAFLKRARETGEQERLDARNVRVISQADVPLRRSWPPSYALIALGALMFGVSAGTGIALLRGIAGHRDRPPQPAPLPAPPAPLPQPAADAPTSDHPLLAELPNVGAGHPLSVFEDPKSRPAAEVRKLHDTLRAGRKRWSGQSILLVAPHDGSETTTVAVNLGLVAAASQSVLLIDTDIRGQALAAILPNQNRGGLIEVASGQKLLSEAIVHDPRTNISMLPLCGEKLEAQGDIKDDDIKAAFDQTKRFDLVIVAGTLAYDNPAAGFFAALVDQIVLITSKGGTQKGDLDAVISTLGSNAHKIRGTVLTNAKA